MHVRGFMFSPWLHERRRLKVISCCCHGNKDTREEEGRGGWVGVGWGALAGLKMTKVHLENMKNRERSKDTV